MHEIASSGDFYVSYFCMRHGQALDLEVHPKFSDARKRSAHVHARCLSFP